MGYNTVNVMGYNIFSDSLKDSLTLSNTKKIINTLNPHSYIIAKKDMKFQDALKASDILLPDGSGIVLSSKFINKVKIKKIAGADLHKHLLEELQKEGKSCFYMGASKSTLEKIKNKLNDEYPAIKVESYSPPFKETFSDIENHEIIQEINNCKPDVLFVGMTAPKQEKWVYDNKDEIDAKIICSIGAVFDFYAGNINRSSPLWIKFHLEWLPRLLKEPRRLWRRNFISTPLFLFNVLLWRIKPK